MPDQRSSSRSTVKGGSGASHAGAGAADTGDDPWTDADGQRQGGGHAGQLWALVGQRAAAGHEPVDVVGEDGEQAAHDGGVDRTGEVEGDEGGIGLGESAIPA